MDLKDVVRNQIIAAGGIISFSRYMQTVLYHPGLGYYSCSRDKISNSGDFITATSQSSIFARTFANQFSLVLKELGSTAQIIEFGAGTGKFAADCVTELARINSLPIKYTIIELSADLRLLQQQHIRMTIPQFYSLFEWAYELPNTKVKAVVFANEVLDAMPMDVFKSNGIELKQQGVVIDGDSFTYSGLSVNDERFNSQASKILADLGSLEDGYLSELNTWIRPWISSIADVLEQGVVFLCDYGYHRDLYYSSDRSMGTLSCYYEHTVNYDPFINIGEQDITAHVDFTAVAEAVVANNCEMQGYMNQANFLKNANVADIYAYAINDVPDCKKMLYKNDLKDLLLNDKLAEVFKVFSFSKNIDGCLSVFDNDENIDYLL